jgi:hypothetical protein
MCGDFPKVYTETEKQKVGKQIKQWKDGCNMEEVTF